MKSSLIEIEGPWRKGYALADYNFNGGGRTFLGECVYRYVYRNEWYLVDSLARIFTEVTRSHWKEADILLGIPSIQKGEYDPMNLLMSWITQYTSIPHQSTTLVRDTDTCDPRKTYEDQERFKIVRADIIREKSVCLIDHVVFSGVTLCLATRALMEAGAASVTVLGYTKVQTLRLDEVRQ